MDDTERRARARWLEVHVLPHEPWLRRQLQRSKWACVDIDDVVQDCLRRLLELDRVDTIVNPQAYLVRVAQSIILSEYRRRRVVEVESVPCLEKYGIDADGVPQDEAFEARRQLQRVSAAMEHLPPRRREILLLRRLSGFSIRSTADRLGISESSVEKHVRFALRDLRLAAAREI